MEENLGENIEKILILGCGWLGQLVGQELSKNGYKVFGSYRSSQARKSLCEKGIHGFYIDFNESTKIPEDVIEGATHVFIFLPPSAAKTKAYEELLYDLAKQFSNSIQVIFSSSTGVYPSSSGTYDENFEIDPNKPNRLFPAESTLRNLLEKRLTIFRLGGLIGPGRHPAYSLSGKKLSNDGTNPVNLIHVNDIIIAVKWVCENNHFGHTYNLVHPDHPSKKAYYTEAAIHFGITPPEFGTEPAANRLVIGNVIEEQTSFEYRNALNNFDDFSR